MIVSLVELLDRFILELRAEAGRRMTLCTNFNEYKAVEEP
jgi:hypothetical protein